MSCVPYNRIIKEELQAYLDYLISETAELESMRNELRANFKQRPTEEKNIIKDVLTIHTEFDSGLEKIQSIVSNLSSLPSESAENTVKAELMAKDLVTLQKSLVSKHSTMHKLFTQKQNYSILRQNAEEKLLNQTSENTELNSKATEIKNYDHGNLFSKKVKLLNSEIARLKSVLSSPAISSNPPALLGETENSVIGLSTAQASIKLQEIVVENKSLEQEIGKINSKFLNKEQFLGMKKEITAKGVKIEELKRILKGMEEGVRGADGQRRSDSMLKIKWLDTIVGRKSPFQNFEPRSPKSERKSNLLQSIEASLLRVRSIASPMPKG